MLMTRQKIAGILCVLQDFLTPAAAFLAAKTCAGAIGTASNKIIAQFGIFDYHFLKSCGKIEYQKKGSAAAVLFLEVQS